MKGGTLVWLNWYNWHSDFYFCMDNCPNTLHLPLTQHTVLWWCYSLH